MELYKVITLLSGQGQIHYISGIMWHEPAEKELVCVATRVPWQLRGNLSERFLSKVYTPEVRGLVLVWQKPE